MQEKILHWKPVFGDTKNRIIIQLIEDYNKAIKNNDDDAMFRIENKLNNYF